MKRLISILITFCFSTHLMAQDNTIIFTEHNSNLSGQVYFTSGYGRELPTSHIKKYWDQGKYITSAAYTLEGWFLIMSNTSDISDQAYYYSLILLATGFQINGKQVIQ